MRAARWIRVSSGSQSEESQIPVIDDKCAELGWEVIDRTFRLHDKSASKGEQQAEQDAAVDALAAGEFDVLVCTESDRLDRRGPRAAYAFLWRLEVVAGRSDVVFVANDPKFGQDDIGSEILSTIRMAGARDEIKLKKRRINETFREMDANGAFRGQPPVGYEAVGVKYAMRLVPSSRAQDIRDAFIDAAGDFSTTALGERLGMIPDAVSKMLKNKVYSTGRYEVHRHDGVVAVHRCEPLVTVAQQNAALEGLKRRRTGDNVSSRALTEDDYSGALWCPCGASTGMHRYFAGGRKNKNGTTSPKVRRYRCDGPDGCGKSVRADDADSEAEKEMRVLDNVPVLVTRVVNDAAGYKDELERVILELRELPLRGLDDDQEDAEKTRLRAERDRLKPLAEAEGERRTVSEILRREDGSIVTHGQRWAALDMAGRRIALTRELKITVQSLGDRSGRVKAEVSGWVDVSL